jgi:hypothetical protein
MFQLRSKGLGNLFPYTFHVCAITHINTSWILITKPRFNPNRVHVRFKVDKVALQEVSLWISSVSIYCITPPSFHHHSLRYETAFAQDAHYNILSLQAKCFISLTQYLAGKIKANILYEYLWYNTVNHISSNFNK